MCGGVPRALRYALLLLMALRLCWRLVEAAPAPPPETPQWKRLAARLSHGALCGFTMLVALRHHFITRDGVTARMIGQWSRPAAAGMAE
jgi:cytochrome b561